MPFDYLHPNVPACYENASEKAEAQYRKELEDRAALLHRLHYTREAAIDRLRGNLAWDWECSPEPAYVERVRKALPEIVQGVFDRPRPPDKGRRVTAADLKVAPSD